jgi:hypothetical protein
MIETPESSNISRIGYEESNRILRVEFKNGSLYDYFDIPEVVFDSMKNAGSKGQYLAQNIKGTYRYAKV